MANGFKFPDTGIRKSYVRKNQEHLGIGHLPYSANEKTYTPNTTGTPSGRRPSYYNTGVTYRNTSMNLRTGEGMRDRNSIGVMNAAHAKSFGKALKSYGKGFKKAVKGQVRSEKIIDRGTNRLANIDKRFSKRLAKKYGKYISAVMNPGSVSPKKQKRLAKQAVKLGLKYDEKMKKVSSKIGDRAYNVKLRNFAKGAKGFSKFKSESGTAPFNAKGQPTHTNPVYTSYKEFDTSSKQVSKLKANKQSNLAGKYLANLNRARDLSLEKVTSFASGQSAYSINKINKAQNSVYSQYKRKKNPGYGTFNM